MKPKTRTIPNEELEALIEKLFEVKPVYDIDDREGFGFRMVSGDFEPTQNMAEARWVMIDSLDYTLVFQVDGVNDAILLIPE